MLTISRLKRFGIAYYNDTADQAKQASMDRQRANGGLGEYYSEGDTRTPTWLIVGDAQSIAATTGLSGAALDGGEVDTETARIWLDEGRAPSGAKGRVFTQNSVHGFDLTFAAPKSVSLLRALTDDLGEKIMAGRPPSRCAGSDGLSASPCRLHPGAQPGHRDEGSAAPARLGGDRVSARDVAVWGPAFAYPCDRAPTASPAPTERWCRWIRSRCITKPRPPE